MATQLLRTETQKQVYGGPKIQLGMEILLLKYLRKQRAEKNLIGLLIVINMEITF